MGGSIYNIRVLLSHLPAGIFYRFFIEIPVANGQMQELYVYAAIWSTSVSLTKFLITVRTRLPLHFISSLHCAPLKRLFGILFFVAPSSRCLSDSSSPGLKPPCAFCFFKYCWQVQDAAFDVY